ncbi:MAG: delta-60 repeat domain-containing protein [Candidatus Glassbacteria bacterium]
MRKFSSFYTMLILAFTFVRPSPGVADPGDLDPAFGDSGIVILDLQDESDYPNSPAITSDGKIVVVGGHLGSTDWDFMVVRYNTDGSLDSTFSEDGMLISDYAGYRDDWIDVEVQPDDKIVTAGWEAGDCRLYI